MPKPIAYLHTCNRVLADDAFAIYSLRILEIVVEFRRSVGARHYIEWTGEQLNKEADRE